MQHSYFICPKCGALGQFTRHCGEEVIYVGSVDSHVVFQNLGPAVRMQAAKELIGGSSLVSVTKKYATKKALRKLGWK